MLVALSRFRVANEMEAAVREAFVNRPRLVDSEPGFLGIETFTDAKDPTIFYLVTRWTDEGAFRRWHSSDAHHASHRGIPKGLKLDAALTEVTLLERIDDRQGSISLEELTIDKAPIIARALSRTSSTCVLSATLDGVVLACNSALARRLGLSLEDILGATMWGHLADGSRSLLEARIAAPNRRCSERILLNFSPPTGEFSLECEIDVQPDGFLLIGETPVRAGAQYDEQIAQLNNELAVLTRENIRKSQALERALAEVRTTHAALVEKNGALEIVNELKNEFLGMAAHDLRGPIGNIHTLAGLLLDGDETMDSTERLDFLGMIGRLSEGMLELLTDLLDIARIESGRLLLSPKIVDVAAFVAEVGRYWRLPAERKHIRFVTELGADVETAMLDKERVRQVLDNLVGNAIKYSPAGTEVRLVVRTGPEGIEFAVVDRGPGIRLEEQRQLFAPFQRASTVATGGERSTGLGLSICKKIVEGHEGTIRVESVFGRGSTFGFTLPQPDAGIDDEVPSCDALRAHSER